MSTNSKIEWTDATWNPVSGCTRVSAGCDHCYAVRQSYRLEKMGQEKYAGLTVLNAKGERHFNGVIHLDEAALTIPLKRKAPTVYFVNSMSDLFHRDVPFEFINRVFEVMEHAQQHTYQILTKRAERMSEYMQWRWGEGRIPCRNIWLGVSCEDALVLHRVKSLQAIPAAIRFLSVEPLLGPMPRLPLFGIHWVIVGGESGPGARPMHPSWARAIRDQCVAAGVPFFFKQWGVWAPFVDSVDRYGSIVDNSSYNRALRKMIRAHGGTKLLDDRPDGWQPYMIEEGMGVTGMDSLFLVNVGKHAAGRLLDGKEWNEMPKQAGAVLA